MTKDVSLKMSADVVAATPQEYWNTHAHKAANHLARNVPQIDQMLRRTLKVLNEFAPRIASVVLLEEDLRTAIEAIGYEGNS